MCRKDWASVAPKWYQHSLPVMKTMLHKPQLWQVHCRGPYHNASSRDLIAKARVWQACRSRLLDAE